LDKQGKRQVCKPHYKAIALKAEKRPAIGFKNLYGMLNEEMLKTVGDLSGKRLHLA